MTEEGEGEGLPTAAKVTMMGIPEYTEQAAKFEKGDELVLRQDVVEYLEIEKIINHLARSHRNLEELNFEGDLDDSLEENERLQRKLESLLGEVQSE